MMMIKSEKSLRGNRDHDFRIFKAISAKHEANMEAKFKAHRSHLEKVEK